MAGDGGGGPACDVVDLRDLSDVDVARYQVVVILDVIRAFTTAVAAFERGAAEIRCVAGLDEARTLAAGLPGAVLMGEERGRRPEGFDAGNSPFDLAGLDLAGRTVVQRTTNGTRGLVHFASAPVLLAAAAANAGATARWIRARTTGRVLLVATGDLAEDRACARYLAALAEGRIADQGVLSAAILATRDQHVASWSGARGSAALAEFDADVAACAEVDTSRFVLRGTDAGTSVILRPAGDPQVP